MRTFQFAVRVVGVVGVVGVVSVVVVVDDVILKVFYKQRLII